MSTLEARARELTEKITPCRCHKDYTTRGKTDPMCVGCEVSDDYVAALVAFAREHAERALRQWAAVHEGNWWLSEGRTYRIVERVPNSGPSSEGFATRDEAEAKLSNIISAALAAAEESDK